MAAFGAAVALILLAIIWPTIQAISDLNSDTWQLRQYLEKKYEGVKELRPSQKKIALVKEAVARYPEYLLSAGDELVLINALEAIANNREVVQKIANPNAETSLSKTTRPSLGLSLTTTGSYKNLLGYLSDVEHLPYFITIEQLSLAPQERDSSIKNSSPDLVLRLVIKVYVK